MSDSPHQAVNDAMIEALTFVRSFLDHDRSKPFSVALSTEATVALGEALIQMFRAEARRRAYWYPFGKGSGSIRSAVS